MAAGCCSCLSPRPLSPSVEPPSEKVSNPGKNNFVHLRVDTAAGGLQTLAAVDPTPTSQRKTQSQQTTQDSAIQEGFQSPHALYRSSPRMTSENLSAGSLPDFMSELSAASLPTTSFRVTTTSVGGGSSKRSTPTTIFHTSAMKYSPGVSARSQRMTPTTVISVLSSKQPANQANTAVGLNGPLS